MLNNLKKYTTYKLLLFSLISAVFIVFPDITFFMFLRNFVGEEKHKAFLFFLIFRYFFFSILIWLLILFNIYKIFASNLTKRFFKTFLSTFIAYLLYTFL